MPDGGLTDRLRRGARGVLPQGAKRWLKARGVGGTGTPPPGSVDFGDLGRRTPISAKFGMDRGTVLDRYWIEGFLAAHADEVRGRVLEVGDDNYTRRFGGGDVTQSDVLHVEEGNPLATIVADLAADNDVPSDAFDCIIFTHTSQMIYDQQRMVAELHRILRPGGVLLLSTHGMSRVGRRAARDSWAVYWRITTDTAERIFGERFGAERVTVTGHGNVLAATAFLHGLAAEELSREDLDAYDPDYQVLVNVRAVKAP